jgi:hypothetical protein
LTGLGPPVPRCAFVGQGPVLPIVDGLEGSGTAKYAELPVVHSERKFQSHPAVPPARLIVLNFLIFQSSRRIFLVDGRTIN